MSPINSPAKPYAVKTRHETGKSGAPLVGADRRVVRSAIVTFSVDGRQGVLC